MMRIDTSDLLGKTFQYGGRGPDKYDCYGLAMEVSRRAGIDLPPWESVCERIAIDEEISRGKAFFHEVQGPKAYCLVTFAVRPPYTSHIGVVLGDCRRFIHIMQASRVTIERLDRPEWAQRITGFWELKE